MYEELENILSGHLYNMEILKKNCEIKKKNAILDNLMGIVVRDKYDINTINEFIDDVNNDVVLDLNLFNKGGNIKNFVNEKWLNLIISLWRFRSVGLGTPNSASGEGEFVFIFSSKYIIKPNKGDVLINNKNFEIKGESPRISGNITGRNFNMRTLKISKKFNLSPNLSKGSLYAVEIEKHCQEKYWKKELNKLNLDEQKYFINEWLFCMDDKYHTDSIDKIFENGEFSRELLTKEIVIILYSIMLNTRKFNNLCLLGDSTNIKIFDDNIDNFKENIYNNNIILKTDYFRINQDLPIAWYVE